MFELNVKIVLFKAEKMAKHEAWYLREDSMRLRCRECLVSLSSIV
jgi:hypothetical protein